MKPIVLICTHGRREITSYNINSLLSQSVRPEIVLVVSDLGEKIFYQNKFPEIHLLSHPNVPLGAKWQFGVQHSYNLKADPLIILGSDDILGPNCIETYSKLAEEKQDFVALKHWYIHYKGKAYLCEYLAKIPLGGGRAYSYELLKEMGGKLFDDKLNRHLDDLAIKKIRNIGLEIHYEPSIALHAVKGSWVTMNPFNRNHPNIKILHEYNSKDILRDLPC